jgi:peptidyl-prolyl cis-trans isomerase SurA
MMNQTFTTMRRRIIAIAVLLLIASSISVQSQSRLDRSVLMTIGKEDVTVQEFMNVYMKNNVNTEVIDRKSLVEYLDLYTKFKLKVIEAEHLRMDTSASFINELAGYRQQLAKPYFNDETVSEALLKEAYERRLKDVRASHILIMVDKNASAADTLAAYNKIMKLRERILKGESFGAVAVEASDDPSARDREAIPGQQPFRPGNKGDLGYFSVFDMVYPFENGAYTTPVGELSMPVRSDFGYHLIKVTERSEAVGVVEAAHIYVALQPGSDEEELLEKEDKINNIYQKITEGMSFEEAARQYSEDRASAPNKGILNKFTVNRIVPEFVETIKKLEPGEVAPPVRTMYGYHIIKLVGLEKPGSFEAEERNLRERLSRDARARKSEEAVISKIKSDAKFRQWDKNLQEFIDLMDSTLTRGEFDASAYANFNKRLFRLGKQNFTQADFAGFIQENQSKQNDIRPEVYAHQLYKDFVAKSAIAYEDELLEAKHPEFRMLMNEYRDGIMLFDLMDKKVWTKAVRDTTGLQAFHAANEQNYMWDERVEASVYSITNADDLEKVQALINKIDDDLLLREAVDADSIRGVRIQAGKFEKGDNTYVDMVEWISGLYGPLSSDVDRFLVFVRIRGLLPPQPKALSESRGLITSDYQNYLEAKWMEELRQKYPVVINQRVLEQVKSTYTQ